MNLSRRVPFLFLFFFSFCSFSHAIIGIGNIIPIAREPREHDLLTRDNHHHDQQEHAVHHEHTPFPNPRLERAHNALQAWKRAIYSDPLNFTSNWVGPDVCNYKGVFCAKALDNDSLTVVAGVDLNHANLAGNLPCEIEHLTDVSLLHLNSNRFCGVVPKSINKLKLLYELDLSNNGFVGPFPEVVLDLPNLKYLDLRFNNFEGELPCKLFDKDLDAIFLNNNKFQCTIPENIGNSPATVIVMSHNELVGCIPCSIGKMAGTLDEFIVSNNHLSGCLTEEITLLNSTTVFDISNNKFTGDLPRGMCHLQSMEILNIANNEFRNNVSGTICTLPNLSKFKFSGNYFDSKGAECRSGALSGFAVDDKRNCFEGEGLQRPEEECRLALSKTVDCMSPGIGISPTLAPGTSPPKRK